MKLKSVSVLVFIILLITIECHAQKKKRIKNRDSDSLRNNVIIEHSIFDFQKLIPGYIISNSQIRFSIMDVNPYIYSASIREIQKDFIDDSELLSRDLRIDVPNNINFSSIKLNDFFLPSIGTTDALIELEGIERKLKIGQDSIQEIETELNQLNTIRKDNLEFESLKIYNKKDITEDQKKEELLSIQVEPSEPIKKIDINIDKKRQQLKKIKSFYEKNLSDRNAKLKAITDDSYKNTQFINYIKEYIKVVSGINDKVNLYNELILLVHSNQKFEALNKAKIKILKSHLDQDGREYDHNLLLRNCKNLFDELGEIMFRITDIYNNVSDKSKLAPAYNQITKYHLGIDSNKIAVLCQDILKLYNSISEEYWKVTYQTTAISPKADKISYLIEFEPKANNFSRPSRPLRFDYNFDIRGGTKVDVSAGLLFHFNLSDDNYSLKKLTDSTTLIINEGKAEIVPTVGALLNIYRRSNSNFKLALNIGTGTNIQNIYYYSGISFLLGRSERIGIGGGLVGGSVKRISSFYTENGDNNKDLNGNILVNKAIDDLGPDVVTRDVFKLGSYFTITYNLTGNNKETFERGLKK